MPKQIATSAKLNVGIRGNFMKSATPPQTNRSNKLLIPPISISQTPALLLNRHKKIRIKEIITIKIEFDQNGKRPQEAAWFIWPKPIFKEKNFVSWSRRTRTRTITFFLFSSRIQRKSSLPEKSLTGRYQSSFHIFRKHHNCQF